MIHNVLARQLPVDAGAGRRPRWRRPASPPTGGRRRSRSGSGWPCARRSAPIGHGPARPPRPDVDDRRGATHRRLTPVVRLAPAKLNLTLAVVGRRDDGFHALHSVFVPLGLADRLSLAPAGGDARDTLHVDGLDRRPARPTTSSSARSRPRAPPSVAAGPAGRARPRRSPPASRSGSRSRPGSAAARRTPPRPFDGALEAWGAELDDGAPRGTPPAASARTCRSSWPAARRSSRGAASGSTPLHGLHGAPGVLLVTPAVAVRTPEVFAVFDGAPRARRRRRGPDDVGASRRGARDGLSRRGPRRAGRRPRVGQRPAAGRRPRRTRARRRAPRADPAARPRRSGCPAPGRPSGRSILRSRGRGGRAPPSRRPSSDGTVADASALAPPSDHRRQRSTDRTPREPSMTPTRPISTVTNAPRRRRPVQPGDRRRRPRLLRRPGRDRPGDPELRRGTIEEETERTLRNIGGLLDAAGVGFADVVKTTVFLADMADFAAMNGVYATFFPDPPPARTTVQVAALPQGLQGRDRGRRHRRALDAVGADRSRRAGRRLTLPRSRPYHPADQLMTLPIRPSGRLQRGHAPPRRPTPRMNPPSPTPAASTVRTQTAAARPPSSWPPASARACGRERPKVLHPLCGRPMLAYVLDAWAATSTADGDAGRPGRSSSTRRPSTPIRDAVRRAGRLRPPGRAARDRRRGPRRR